MLLENKLQSKLKSQGADFVYFVDISKLSVEQNKNYPNAVLIGQVLSQKFIKKVSTTPDYVKMLIRDGKMKEDEFHKKEISTDQLADALARDFEVKGYSAYSQSEENIEMTGYYDEKNKSTPLPHKTIALMAGLGWIGKHNLLVTPEYGSAICMCTVLTDAPLNTVSHPAAKSQCGECTICKDVCKVNAIMGETWEVNTSRDTIVDVDQCDTCLECLVFCPWTQAYAKNEN